MLLAVLASFWLASAGCTRTRYRVQADQEVNCIVDHKSAVVGSDPQVFRINIDGRSRMYDPYNPDREPMPPDDPLSNRYMQVVDCKRGSREWDVAPRTPYVENPAWMQYLPLDEEGHLVLDQQTAVQTALLQSPDYQQNLEELYLSALDVTFERFRFDSQFFGGSEIFFTADGRDRSGTGSASSLLEVGTSRPGNRYRVEKLSATGGNLVVGMANSLIWQFAGSDDYTSSTILDFSLVQPLLRAGGRTRVLERLTIAERTLLANVRTMERYRRGFYRNIVNGGDPGVGPSRRGGFFGGSGLEGFTGVGGGGFGRVGTFQGGGQGGGFFGGGGGGGFTGGAGAQGAGGFLGLLQSTQEIRNQRSNVVALRDNVEQLKASNEAGRIDRFQVDLAQQALYNAQSQLLTSEQIYELVLENYKITLGLPPDLPVKVNDPLLDRFQLLDPDLTDLRETVLDLVSSMRQESGLDEAAVGPVLPPPADAGAAPAGQEDLDNVIARALELKADFDEQWNVVEQDVAELERQLPVRRQSLLELADRPEVDTAQIDPALFDVAGLDERARTLHEDLNELRQDFDAIWARVDELSRSQTLPDLDRQEAIVNALTDLSGRLLELGIVQARARLDGITVDPLDLAPEQALQIASVFRRDWANARASLVDSWRLIAFNANDLQSDLNLFFSGDIGNVGDNPFRLRSTDGRLRVGLQIDPPITRRAERNVYRQSLIEYQQARRDYYQFRDRVNQQLRNTISQIRLNELNFELRRAAVLVAIAQVDLTQLRLSEPPQPGVVAELSVTLARDLVQSLSDLVNVQNDFLSVWVNNEVQRLNLEYDLGVMELDPTGERVDLGVPLSTYLAAVGCETDPLMSADLEYFPPIEFLPAEPMESIEGQPPAGSDEKDLELLPPPSENGNSTDPLGKSRRLDRQVVLAVAELPVKPPQPTATARRLPPVEQQR